MKSIVFIKISFSIIITAFIALGTLYLNHLEIPSMIAGIFLLAAALLTLKEFYKITQKYKKVKLGLMTKDEFFKQLKH